MSVALRERPVIEACDSAETGSGALAQRTADKASLRRLLNASDRALRRDECGDWRINGTNGHIYADLNGWRLYVVCHSVRAWTAAKKRLSFCRVTQDGDDEGVLHLAALPTTAQAAIIRDVLGIRKRRQLDASSVAELVERGVKSRFQAKSSASGECAVG